VQAKAGSKAAGPVLEDWWLVRDAENRVGWVLARMVDIAMCRSISPSMPKASALSLSLCWIRYRTRAKRAPEERWRNIFAR